MDESDIILLLEQRWVTKDELREFLGIKSERAVRAYIEALNLKLKAYNKCIVSTASRKGYKIPNAYSEEDMSIVALAVEELKSKAISIFERRQVLEEFIKFARSAEGSKQEVQLTLF